jgi:glucan phosphoethanolaminetransferase (alkaline phosphatase superfamily)
MLRLLVLKVIAISLIAVSVILFCFDVIVETKLIDKFYSFQIDNTFIVLSIGLIFVALFGGFIGYLLWETPGPERKEKEQEKE